MRIRQVVRTNEAKVFKTNYIMCAILSFFGMFGPLGLSYSSKALNKAMWKGALLGFLHSFAPFAVLWLVSKVLRAIGYVPDANGIFLLLGAVYTLHLISIFVIASRIKTEN